MAETTHPKYRKAAFLDLNTMEPVLTAEIQPTIQDKGRWLNIASQGKPLTFQSEIERDAWLKAKRREARDAPRVVL